MTAMQQLSLFPDLDRTRAISSLTVGEAQRLIGLLKTLERAA
jgi:hypothetical protein